MFKRMSILVRRSADSREQFAAKWEYHGTLVSRLPLIRTYLQNHVVEELTPGGAITADGIVELRFDRPEDMASAFSSPNAAAVKADEPNFLGHGTGYALANDSLPLISAEGAKLVVAVGADADASLVGKVSDAARAARELVAAARDDIGTVIARPEMAAGPQQVASFLHVLFSTPAAASEAGRYLAESVCGGATAVSVFRVRTKTMIEPA